MSSECDRSLDLHKDIYRRLDVWHSADKQYMQYMQYMNDFYKLCTRRTSNSWRFGYGISEPRAGRITESDSRYTGPWHIERSADSNDVTYVCKLASHRVTYRTVNLTRMKPYNHRPSSLQTDITSTLTALASGKLTLHHYLQHWRLAVQECS